MSLQIRDYEPEDYGSINKLINQTYNANAVKFYRDIWDWLYLSDRQLSNKQPSTLSVAEADGEIVAIIGGINRQLYLQGKFVDAMYLINFMAKPDSSSRFGIRLSRAFVKSHAVSIGYSNSRLKRYWKYILGIKKCSLPRPVNWIYPLALEGIFPGINRYAVGRLASQLSRKVSAWTLPKSVSKKYQHCMVENFHEEFDRLNEELLPQYHNLSVRSSDYLQWRYCDCPLQYQRFALRDHQGQLVAWAVGRLVNKNGLSKARIVDYFGPADDPVVWQDLLRPCYTYYAKRNASMIHLLSGNHPLLTKCIAKTGLLVKKPKIDAPKFIAKSATKQVDVDQLIDPPSWHFSLGDSDLDLTP